MLLFPEATKLPCPLELMQCCSVACAEYCIFSFDKAFIMSYPEQGLIRMSGMSGMFSLFSPTKVCNFLDCWILPSQRGNIRQQRAKIILNQHIPGAKEKGNAIQWVSRNGGAFSCYKPLKQAQEWSTETGWTYSSLTSSLSGFIWFTDKKSRSLGI